MVNITVTMLTNPWLDLAFSYAPDRSRAALGALALIADRRLSGPVPPSFVLRLALPPFARARVRSKEEQAMWRHLAGAAAGILLVVAGMTLQAMRSPPATTLAAMSVAAAETAATSGSGSPIPVPPISSAPI